jgi:hypothetical protein
MTCFVLPRRLLAIATLIPLAAALICCGCDYAARPTKRLPSQVATSERRTDRGDVLFGTVVTQLRDLASFVDTELQPPTVILDAKKSSDGQDVMATINMHPGTEDGPIDLVFVPGANSRFRGLGVQPGDIIKLYYTLYDQQNQENDIGRTVSTELPVAQVINDNTLLIAAGINQPISEPHKIEVWRYVDDRLEEIAQRLRQYVEIRQPVFDWEPSPDDRVLKQIVERLNQWLRQSEPKTDWAADPLLATLDPTVASDDRLAPLITPAALAEPVMQPFDGRLIQEAVWLRDISRWAQGDSFDAVARATQLFDWTVRNIQLDADDKAVPLRPWQAIAYGHGTAEERAWVFALLCRQQGLDVVMLAVPEAPGKSTAATSAGGSGPDKEQAAKNVFWLPAVLSDGQLYLFDTRLGLPIPGKDGKGVATLHDLRADVSLLRQLDLKEMPYPIAAEQLKHVTAQIPADPFDLSQRARAIESNLSGDDRLTLASNPTALAQKLKTGGEIWDIGVWDFPFRVLRDQLRIGPPARRQLATEFEPFAWRPMLWKARMLHFQGHRHDEANSADKSEDKNPDETLDDHKQAIRMYMSKAVRPPDRTISDVTSAEKQKVYTAAKDDASYWVALLLFDDGKYSSAENWLANPQLAATANGRWASGTRYNLARTYEAQGKTHDAVALYEKDSSPQQHGNRLRAKWLKSQVATPKPDAK